MAKKVVLYLSAFDAERAQEKTYECPDGIEVEGVQTNEAPVLYLLRTYPDISELLCIVTKKARETAWPRFQHTIQAKAPGVQLRDIPYEESQDFSQTVLPEITHCVTPKDEILLETTGGLRNAVMYLLLVSRALSYIGVHTTAAVYSNFNTCKVEDVSHLVDLFDLVGGMQEMANFGSVSTLRAYYGRRDIREPEIEKLLQAMEGLSEEITICRPSLQDRIEEFNAAMERAENTQDPLMQALLPAFRAKFGKKLNIPGVIKWCMSNGMIQQALTIYNELIPDYLLRSPGGLFSVKAGTPSPERKEKYQTESAALFEDEMLGMGRRYKGNDRSNNAWVNTLKHFEELLPGSCFLYDNKHYRMMDLRQIVADYLYLRILRNMINHANDQSYGTGELLLCLQDYHYKNPRDVRVDDIKKALERAMENMKPKINR
ncbi:MAG: hypothetical protein HDT27_07435 [Subdoligranulum sp.]|nr:hypothetical protein [Subdoligranulum sp.]